MSIQLLLILTGVASGFLSLVTIAIAALTSKTYPKLSNVLYVVSSCLVILLLAGVLGAAYYAGALSTIY